MEASDPDEIRQLREENQRLQQEIVRLQAAVLTDADSQNLSPRGKESLLDLAHVLIRDLESRIVYWNRGADLLYGWTQAEALGQVSHTLLQTVFPVSQEAATAALWNEGEWKGELQQTRRDGTKVVVASHQVLHRDSQGNPVTIVEMDNDITELKREQLPLYLAAIVEGSQDAILSKTPEGIITSWNRGAERLYGYSDKEAIGQPITLLVPPERHEELSSIFLRIQSGEAVAPFETVRVRKNGTRVAVSVQVSPIKTQDGEIIGASTIARDITAHKRAEEQMQRLQAEAHTRSLMLDTANDVALDILTSQTGMEALRHIAEAARKLTRARYAALGVARLDGEGLLEFITAGLTAEEEAAIGPRPQGKGLLGLLLQRSEPLRVDALAAHHASSGFPSNHPPMDSFLGVPIRRGDTVMGSLYLTCKETGGAFTDADEVAVGALGAHAAVAIHNWHLLSRQRALLRGLIMGQEEERRSVAYDLHDGLTQYVMASQAHLETAWRAQDAGDSGRAMAERMKGMGYLQHAVVESRRLVNGLRSLTLDEMGLAGALAQLLQEEKARASWHQTQFVHNVDGMRYDVTLETTAYRIAQEALNNARKHAKTNRLHLTLLSEESSTGQVQLRLEIQDWGTGFVPEEKLQETERVGLHSMAERVSLLRGSYILQSAPGKGTLIRAVFPVLKSQGKSLGEEFRGVGK